MGDHVLCALFINLRAAFFVIFDDVCQVIQSIAGLFACLTGWEEDWRLLLQAINLTCILVNWRVELGAFRIAVCRIGEALSAV